MERGRAGLIRFSPSSVEGELSSWVFRARPSVTYSFHPSPSSSHVFPQATVTQSALPTQLVSCPSRSTSSATAIPQLLQSKRLPRTYSSLPPVPLLWNDLHLFSTSLSSHLSDPKSTMKQTKMSYSPATPRKSAGASPTSGSKVAVPSVEKQASSSKAKHYTDLEPSPASTYGDTAAEDDSPITPSDAGKQGKLPPAHSPLFPASFCSFQRQAFSAALITSFPALILTMAIGSTPRPALRQFQSVIASSPHSSGTSFSCSSRCCPDFSP